MTPKCIGIIMDGNRRWAIKNNLPVFEGHRRGYDTLKRVGEWAREAGVRCLIFYAFSTENWNRAKEEVGYLMNLLRWVLKEELQRFKKEKIRITVIGKKELLPEDIQKQVALIEEETKHFSDFHLIFAISYGGRSEILYAVKDIIRENKKEDEITEAMFSEHLWTKGIDDPDIIIRTSGEKRLSNFLPWQSVYSELFFVDTQWPDFSKKEFLAILEEYSKREKRIGK